jgi:sugar phosphate isomerase/epimerase
MLCTRREALGFAALGLPIFARTRMYAASTDINGVDVGAITYSFRSLPDASAVVRAMRSIGFTSVELMYNHAEQLLGAPPSGRGISPDGLRAWRASVDVGRYAEVKKVFADAGMTIRVLCFNMPKSITDPEIDYAFRMAKALGAGAISTTAQVSTARRVAPFADTHQLMVGFHGHDNTADPDEFAKPESFAAAMALSRYHGVNLDIGHFVAAGYDPIAYISEHHARITNLHVKDRKKNHGPNVPFGTGDTPIVGVLQLLKKNAWKIPANIEFEYDGDPLVEVPKCFEFCKRALA